MTIKVFFNNSCSICRAEINHYKKQSDSRIEWIDITNNLEAQKLTSKSYEQLIKKIHVVEGKRIIEGAEAFLIIWKNLPRYRFLEKIIKQPIIFFCFKKIYTVAAKILFKKNKKQLENEKKLPSL